MSQRKKQNTLLMLATPAPTDREKIWAAMRQEKSFTISRIAILTRCEEGKIHDYLRCLVVAGFVVRGEAVRFTKTVYHLMKDNGVDAPRVRKDGTILPASGRNRMWNAMRVLHVFSIAELVSAASLPEAPVAVSEAKTYCLWLVRGGYLAKSGETWSFIPARFTGAKAPQILRVKALFDPNLGEVVYQPNPEGRDDE